jgi:iron complex transport system substrate-binding protein
MTRRKAYKTTFLAALLTTVMCGQAFCFPERAVDDRKKEIVITAKPLRIISLAPTNTELLFALGLDKEIIGVTRYCDYPEAAKKKEKVGGFANVDVDRIVGLRPDLILAFGTIQLPAVEELENRGLKVFWLYPHTVKDILESFERVGKITGRDAEARELRDAVEKDLAGLRKALGALAEKNRPTVFRVMSFNSPATIGAESFQTDLFSLAGGKNAFPAVGEDYFEVGQEELIKGDPDVILVCGDDEKGLKQKMKDNPMYGKLPAVQKGSILVIPCDLTCKPGPRIGEMVRRLARYLHPELQ